MSVTTNSHFANTKNLTLAGVSLASTSNLRIDKTNTRVEGETNTDLTGSVSTHVIRKVYRWSFDSNDISGLNVVHATTAAGTLSATWIASETQMGTPLPNQQITLTQCVIDSIGANPETKALGKYSVSGHTIATSDDSDNFTMVAA